MLSICSVLSLCVYFLPQVPIHLINRLGLKFLWVTTERKMSSLFYLKVLAVADLSSVWWFLLTDMSVRLSGPGVQVRGWGAGQAGVRWRWWRRRSHHRDGTVLAAPALLTDTSVDVGTFLKNNHQVSWQAGGRLNSPRWHCTPPWVPPGRGGSEDSECRACR